VNPWEQRFEMVRAAVDVAPMRASDQDRHEAVLALSEEYASGRLDNAEFERRQGLALEATFVHDLDPLFADLPGRAAPRVDRSVVGSGYPAYGVPAGMPPWAGRRGPRGGGVPFLVAFVALVVAIGFASGGHALWLLVPALWFAMAVRHRRRWAMSRVGMAGQIPRR
jgi:hypothetical protein